MGLSYVKVKISNIEKSRFSEIELLVDTGSTFTWVFKDILKDLKVIQKRKVRFKTIEGKFVDRYIGEALISYEDSEATTIVVFAEERDANVLGTYALEGLGYEVDPVTKRLKKVEAFLAV